MATTENPQPTVHLRCGVWHKILAAGWHALLCHIIWAFSSRPGNATLRIKVPFNTIDIARVVILNPPSVCKPWDSEAHTVRFVKRLSIGNLYVNGSNVNTIAPSLRPFRMRSMARFTILYISYGKTRCKNPHILLKTSYYSPIPHLLLQYSL